MKKNLFKILLVIAFAVIIVGTMASCKASEKPTQNKAYTISFIVDNKVYHSFVSSGNEEILIPTNPVKDGYIFNGWFLDKETNSPFDNKIYLNQTLKKDVSLFPKWILQDEVLLSVTFINRETASGNLPSVEGQKKNAILILPANTQVKDGYAFVGWNDGIATYKAGVEYKLGELDVTFVAQWSIKNAVRFDIGAGVVGIAPTVENQAESEIFALPYAELTKDGYVFGGWSDGKNVYLAGQNYTMSSGELKFVAVWNRKHTINFNIGENATGTAPKIDDKSKNELIKLPNNGDKDTTYRFTNDGYRFVGWRDDTGVYSSGFDYAMPDKDVVFTAQWSKLYKFTYQSETNTLTGELPKEADCISGESVVLIDNGDILIDKYNLAKVGYQFYGWTIGGKILMPKQAYLVENSDVVATAYFKKVHTIVFDKGGIGGDLIGGVAPSNIMQVAGKNITLAINTFIKDGYVFDGWLYDGKKYLENSVFSMLDFDITFVATWKQLKSISFQGGNGALGEKPATLNQNENDTIILPNNTFNLDGNEFIGWSDGVKLYHSGEIFVTPNSSVTFTAQWTRASSGILYTLNADKESYTLTGIGTCLDKTLQIPYLYKEKSVTAIAENAFLNNLQIVGVNLPDSISMINQNAFKNCINLQNINVDAKNNSYMSDNGILFNFDKTEIICYPSGKNELRYSLLNTVKIVKNSAFYGNSYLTEIVLNDNLQTLEDSAFGFCVKLTKIIINESVGSIGSGVFENCALVQIRCRMASKQVGWVDAWHCGQNVLWQKISSGLNFEFISGADEYQVTGIGTCLDKDIVFPNFYNGKKVTKIADNAFSNDATILSVTLLENINSIGLQAFINCANLTKVFVESESQLEYIGRYAFANCVKMNKVSLNNNLKIIDYCAFLNCQKLTDINLPRSVTSIGYQAFENCISLSQITFANDSVLDFIGQYAFNNCESLTEIIIPLSVKTIGKNAFFGCAILSIKCKATSPAENWHTLWSGEVKNITFNV